MSAELLVRNDDLIKNVINIRASVPKHTEVYAVVKANAYGLGCGAAEMLASYTDGAMVSCISEAEKLLPICQGVLNLGSIMSDDESDFVVSSGIVTTVFCKEQLNLLAASSVKFNKRAKAAFKIDTGMNRLGVKSQSDFVELIEYAAAQKIVCESLYSHFYSNNIEICERQYQRFLTITHGYEHHKRHISASTMYDRYPMDRVRVGIKLYQNAVAFYGRVLCVKDVLAGESVSYNATFTARSKCHIAIVGMGYGDGLCRSLSNKGQLKIKSQWCPIVGNICMDMCMVMCDSNVKIGDKAFLFTNAAELATVAEMLGTIPYEVIAGISDRVKRRNV